MAAARTAHTHYTLPAKTHRHFHAMLHKRLDQLFNMIRPRKTVVMALDGPAPLAKLITQRYVLQAYTRKTSNCCCVLHWPGILQPYATHGSIVDIIGIVDSFSMVGIVGIDGIVLGNTSTLMFATLSLPPQAQAEQHRSQRSLKTLPPTQASTRFTRPGSSRTPPSQLPLPHTRHPRVAGSKRQQWSLSVCAGMLCTPHVTTCHHMSI